MKLVRGGGSKLYMGLHTTSVSARSAPLRRLCTTCSLFDLGPHLATTLDPAVECCFAKGKRRIAVLDPNVDRTYVAALRTLVPELLIGSR
jgi:hypothetical protein